MVELGSAAMERGIGPTELGIAMMELGIAPTELGSVPTELGSAMMERGIAPTELGSVLTELGSAMMAPVGWVPRSIIAVTGSIISSQATTANHHYF